MTRAEWERRVRRACQERPRRSSAEAYAQLLRLNGHKRPVVAREGQ